jgi:hypothetical protein
VTGTASPSAAGDYALAPTSLEEQVVDVLWEGYFFWRASQVLNAAAVTMDRERGPRNRPLAWLATGLAGAATAWEWRRRQSQPRRDGDPVMAAEVATTSVALLALSRFIVDDADRGRGDDWFGMWSWFGHAGMALALRKASAPAMIAMLAPQVDAWVNQRRWMPRDAARKNTLNSIGFALGFGWAVSRLPRVGAEADQASALLVREQARSLAERAHREVRERRLRGTVTSLEEIRDHFRERRVEAAMEHSEQTYQPLRAWLAGAEDDEAAASPMLAASGHAQQMTSLVARTERGLTLADSAVVASAALNLLSTTATHLTRHRRPAFVVAGMASTAVYATSVIIGRFGLTERPGAASTAEPFLDRTWSPRADTLFATLLVAFEAASSDRSASTVWAAGQTQVHLAVAATRIQRPAHLAAAWATIGAVMLAADRYYLPEARKHRFRWQADWLNAVAAGLALRRMHTAIWDALDELEQSANDTIEAVAEQVAEAEMAAAQNAVHDTACQSLRYVLSHGEEDPTRLADIMATTIDALEAELSGARVDESGALADALEACAAGYELLGLHPLVEIEGDRPVGAEAMELLVHVANQGLSNALAHGRDTAPTLSLELTPTQARLLVSNRADTPYRGEADSIDHDTAVDPEVSLGGFGLRSARRAVAELGGTLSWGNHPTRTELVLELPLEPDGSPAATR